MDDRVIKSATILSQRESAGAGVLEQKILQLISYGTLYAILLLLLLAGAGPASAAVPCDQMPDASLGDEAVVALSCEKQADRKKLAAQNVPAGDNYFAIIAHPEANNAWVTLGFPDEDEAAKSGLGVCFRAMGPGCFVATQSLNRSFAIGRGSTGKLYYATGATVIDASSHLLAACGEAGDVCMELSHGSAKPVMMGTGSDHRYMRSTWPPMGYLKHVFASAARTKAADSGGSETLGRDIWIATGYQDEASARRAAVDSCARDSGKTCVSELTVASSYLYVFANHDGDTRVGSSPSLEHAETMMRSTCVKEEQCRLTATFDPWNKRLVNHRANNTQR